MLPNDTATNAAQSVTLHGLEHFYMPFARVDDENRIVEGYCYTSGRVPGDKWNLTRGALERAAANYMQMPAVRSMHQPIAAGKGLGLVWDDKGCMLRAEIVDDNEWNKVKKGVYRGFSLGGRPTIARGDDIEEFDWIETSLVDRPKDPGALFTVKRADGAAGDDKDADYQVTVLPALAADVSRVMTSDDVPARENLEGSDDDEKDEKDDDPDGAKLDEDGNPIKKGGNDMATRNDNTTAVARAGAAAAPDVATAMQQLQKLLADAQQAPNGAELIKNAIEAAKASLSGDSSAAGAPGAATPATPASAPAKADDASAADDGTATDGTAGGSEAPVDGAADPADGSDPGDASTFSGMMQSVPNAQLSMAMTSLLATILKSTPDQANQSVDEFADWLKGWVKTHLDSNQNPDQGSGAGAGEDNSQRGISAQVLPLLRMFGDGYPICGPATDGALTTFKQRIKAVNNEQLSAALSVLCQSLQDGLYPSPTPDGADTVNLDQVRAACMQSISEFSDWARQWVTDSVAVATAPAAPLSAPAPASTDESGTDAMAGAPTDDATARAAELRTHLGDLVRLLNSNTDPAATNADANAEALARAAGLETKAAELLQRAETAESEVTRVSGDLSKATADLELVRNELSTATGEVERLRKQPLTASRAEQFPTVPAQRSFAANDMIDPAPPAVQRAQLIEQKTELMTRAKDPATTGEERQKLTEQIASIDVTLTHALG